MNNGEIYESSLRFIFKQIDLYVEVNKQANKNNKLNKNSNKKESKLKVLE